MEQDLFDYVIVGAGLAGASAAQGIREQDPTGSILLIGEELHLPYHRPPLSKKLWLGKQKTDEIYVYDSTFYEHKKIRLVLGKRIVDLDAGLKRIKDDKGRIYHYNQLLLATGVKPRTLSIPGGQLEGVNYFRKLDDYLALQPGARPGSKAVVIGGGFIGSEMAAALAQNKIEVTLIFPEPYICSRLFPEALGQALLRLYQEKGVTRNPRRPANSLY